jgi:hypothetical protein
LINIRKEFKMPKKVYDCVLVETSESENLYIDEIQKTLKLLPKNEQISVFDTGLIYIEKDFCAQGFATPELLYYVNFDINALINLVFTKYNPDELKPQEFTIVFDNGSKFAFLVKQKD